MLLKEILEARQKKKKCSLTQEEDASCKIDILEEKEIAVWPKTVEKCIMGCKSFHSVERVGPS